MSKICTMFLLIHCTLYASSGSNIPSTPRKVVYIDTRGYRSGAPQEAILAAVQAGYNVINLAFFTTSGPLDICLEWSRLNHSIQSQTVNMAHSLGAVVMVSAGGAFDIPWTTMDGYTYGDKAAQFALSNNLDGVDFDLENLQENFTFRGMDSELIITWLSNATSAANAVLAKSNGLKIITHAPQAPYFGKIGGGSGTNPWTALSGGYTAVYERNKENISWFNVQFYNQGIKCYIDYLSLFLKSNYNSSCPDFPGTSVTEIQSYGIPLDKIVIGKYVCHQGGNGGISPKDMCVVRQEAMKNISWNAGVMIWEWMPGDCTPDSAAYIQQTYQTIC